MKNKISLIGLLFCVLTVAVSCNSNNTPVPVENATEEDNSMVVKEILQASEYTYINGTANGKDLWIAAPKTLADVGQTIYYMKSMEMTNFESKDLNRTFESVLFVERVSSKPITSEKEVATQAHQSGKAAVGKQEIEIEKAADGISIGELFENAAKYDGQVVKVKGKVVKFSAQIMKKNWVHLQDGTDFKGEFDLTITTLEEVKVDDIVTFEGKVAIDKDFGMGYFYEVIMEESSIIE